MKSIIGKRFTRDGSLASSDHPIIGFRTRSRSINSHIRARTGELSIHGVRVRTPYLFPVLNILTGPPGLERNGATHKFLKSYLIFEKCRAGIMTEVLHFTDYPFTPRNFYEWFPHILQQGDIRDLTYWVNHGFELRGETDRTYNPLFFLDSGGFRLLFNRDVDISEYGYAADQESILKLQLAYGADIVASLDYPVPPSLNVDEARDRIEKSVENAVLLMRLLYKEHRRDFRGDTPFPVLAVHGQNPDQIRFCIANLLHRLDQEDLIEKPFGIGIGSLVPLRMSDARKVVNIVQSAIDALYASSVPSRFDVSKTPVHAFGITGDMIPVLTYLGVDTFDSSSYIKSSSVLDYYDPDTWNPINFHKLEGIVCSCDVCQDIKQVDIVKIKEILKGIKIMGNKERIGMRVGRRMVNIKSDVYGLIAAHNLNLQDREILQVSQAIDADEMSKYLVRFGLSHPRSKQLVELIAQTDSTVAAEFSHFQIRLLPINRNEEEGQFKTISLQYNPQSFDVRNKDYHPNKTVDRMLILACSKTKPYCQSKSHSTISQFLRSRVGDDYDRCHKVTISGMYGPVPIEFEDDPAVLGYEYVLGSSAKKQALLITERLVDFLIEHARKFTRIVAYVTASAYRKVVEDAFRIVRTRLDLEGMPQDTLRELLIVVPDTSRGAGTRELLQHVNLNKLAEALYPDVPYVVEVQPMLDLDAIVEVDQEME